MNNLENRRNKINSCMSELFNLYMEDRKNIKGSISLDGVKCTLTFEETPNEQVVDKKIMTIDGLKGIAINCKTKEESDEVVKLSDKLGIESYGGSTCYKSCSTVWNSLREKTCYIFKDNKWIAFGRASYFEKNGYTIKSAQWFLDNFTPNK